VEKYETQPNLKLLLLVIASDSKCFLKDLRETMHRGDKDFALDSSYYWIWDLPFFLFYSTRSSQLLHERPNQGLLRALLCFIFSPMV